MTMTRVRMRARMVVKRWGFVAHAREQDSTALSILNELRHHSSLAAAFSAALLALATAVSARQEGTVYRVS